LSRLLQTSESLNGTLARTVDYAYDNNGNLLTVTSVTYTDGVAGAPVLEQNNTYDLTNQLIRTVTSGGTIVENTYNGDGLRVVKSVNGSLTRFLYQYDKIVLELNALGDQTGRNVYGLNLISRTFGEDTFFYFYNGHADVTALLASDGTIAATYYYDAFGNILDQTGTATSNILYAGYQYDPETGLYYLNARMYDPVTARFIQEDTYLGERNDPLSLNLYTYCKNSPIRYSDPTGHNTQEDYKYQQDMFARQRKSSTRDAYEYQTRTTASLTKQAEIAQEKKNQDNLITAIGIGALAVGCIVLGIVTMGAAVPVIAIAGAGLLGAGIGIGMTEIQDLSDNGTIDYGFNTYAGAAAGGFVAGATLPYSAGAGLAGVMGAGALSSMAGNATNQMISTGKVNASQFAIAGVTGALTCGIASMAPQTVTAVTQGVKSISSKLTASSANATVNAADTQIVQGNLGTAGSQAISNTQTSGVGAGSGVKTDFYVLPSGEAFPATAYRYMDSNNAVEALTTGQQYTTYIGIENYESAAVVRDACQISPFWSDCKVRGTFDTLQIIDDIYVPTTLGNTTNIPEPFAVSYPQYGYGNAQQFRVDKVVKFSDVTIIGD